MPITLQFLGGAETVTGSKFLISDGRRKVLVDCGLFQGVRALRRRNWERFPVEPRSIDAAIVTHAHLDHVGALPILQKGGFHRLIYMSAPTRDLARLILEDSARLQEEDAGYANRQGYSKHRPARPLYTRADVRNTAKLFKTLACDRWQAFLPGWKVRLQPSGHLLGSVFVEIEVKGVRVSFSGDLGRPHPLILPSPAHLEEADYLVLESTYGDRLHHGPQVIDELARITHDTVQRGGVLLIPSFAVGRAQEVIHLLTLLKKKRRIPDLPIYLDSPMGIRSMQVLAMHAGWHTLSSREQDDLVRSVTPIRTPEESRRLLRRDDSCIVVAGSGMITGGRILHHLTRRLSDERNTVLLTGYQAAGTRGRLLQDGASELKMHGSYFPVRACIEKISLLSAHADQSETLAWLGGFKSAPKRTFIVHGDPQASDALRIKIKDQLGWDTQVPKDQEQVKL